jgi:hypothetical protein
MLNNQRHFLLLMIIFLLLAYRLNSQHLPDPIKVFTESRQELAFPWAGGMNSCQFGKLDINLDGIKDLVVFDRTGNRIMPFLTVQSAATYHYEYAPQYSDKFPTLSHWANFVDYNLDGKEDIFTYSPGYAGFKVYRNTSGTELEFTLQVYPFLTSFQGGGYVNILVTYADYPAIYDLDGDGDLDILTFWGLGSFVEKHRNMSMEKYGNADSLDYEKTDFCWGYFAESEESNVLTLDTCLRCGSGEEETRRIGDKETRRRWEPGEQGSRGAGKLRTTDCRLPTADLKERHTGSTFQVLDLNGDNLPDLLLGDVDYPNLIALYNGGNFDTARMVSYSWQYPADGNPVNLFSMPAAFYNDFDFDGIKDLLVSPFDPNPFLTSNFQSNWFYHNDGSDSQPQFNLQTRSFLQDRMIDVGAGAYPVFCDIDKDGLTDLLIGNYGYYDTSYYDQFIILHTEHTGKIAYLKNTGTPDHPSFTFADRDFAGVSALDQVGLVPAFGDLDGDGDTDMLLGCESGKIIFCINTANPGDPISLEINDLNYQMIDVGAFSTPQLFDLDRDNLTDLIIGEKGGNLNYYRNTGSLQKPTFTLVTDSLGKVNVTDYSVSLDGYSVPFFYRDSHDITHLLAGSEVGELFYYTNIDNNLDGHFDKSDTLAGLIGVQEIHADRGYRTAGALFDLDLDGYPELVAGNFSGGVEYYGRSGESPVNQIVDPYMADRPELNIFPTPARNYITIKCEDCMEVQTADISLYDYKGSLMYHYSGNFNENTTISVGLLPRGLYLLRISLKCKSGNINFLYSSKVILL